MENINIKAYLKLFLLILLLVLIQTNFIAPIFDITPPVLVFSLSLAFLSFGKTDKACFSSFIGGLLLDFLGSGLLGKTSLLFLLLIVASSYIKKYLFDNVLLYLLSVVVFSGAWYFMHAGSFNLDPLFIFLNFIGFSLFYVFLKHLDLNSFDSGPKSLNKGF